MRKTLLLTALVSASAFAQETAPPPPPPQPAPVASPVRPVDAPMIGEEDPGGRVRWGLSGGFGWNIPQSAFCLGGEGRIGYQISNMIAAFATVGATAGFGFGGTATGTGGSVSVTGLAHYYFGAIAEFMFGNLFYVGGGPVLASGDIAGVTVSGGTTGGDVTTVSHRGLIPAFDFRLGLGLGQPQPSPSFRRGGFNLGLSALVMFHPNTTVVRVTGNAGGGSVGVTTNELTVNVIPMLMLGYDSR